jgi:hypothetical protein
MGVKYRSVINSTFIGQQYTVELWDNTFSSTVTNIRLAGEGFELKYMQEGDAIYAPIKESQCKVNLMITDDAAGASLQTWLLGSLLNGDEDRYSLAIYKGFDLWWFGVFLPDIASRQDQSRPYEYSITATDGIGRLKNFEFSYGVFSTPPAISSIVSIIQIIYDALKKLPLYKNTTETTLFSTSVEWYEDNMPARGIATDPLAQTYIDTLAFTKEENGAKKGLTLYQNLENICKHWGMRLILSNGLYRFIQIESYEAGTSYQRFYFRSDGLLAGAATFGSSVTLNLATSTLPRVKSGNQWSYFPPLKSALLKFPFANLNMLTTEEYLPYSRQLPDNITGGSSIRLLFTGQIKIKVNSGAVGALGYKVIVRIKLNLGTSYYLKKLSTSTLNSWSTINTDFAFFEVLIAGDKAEFNLAFFTDEIPVGNYDNNDFEIDVISVIGRNNGISYSYTRSRVAESTSLIYVSVIDGDKSYIPYKVNNTAFSINSEDLIEPDAIMGEMYFKSYFGGLYTGNDSGTYIPSIANWRYKDTGTPYSFNFTRIRAILGAQIKAIPKYQGAIVGAANIDGHLSIIYNGEVYILNGGTYLANSESWNGEWVKVDYQRGDVNGVEGVDINAGDGNQNLYKGVGFLRESVEVLTKNIDANTLFVNEVIMVAPTRVTTSVRSGISATNEAIMVFDTDTKKMYYADGTNWVEL